MRSKLYFSIILLISLLTGSAFASNHYINTYEFTLADQGYAELIYRAEILFPESSFCEYLSINLKNTTNFPVDVSYNDFVMVILYDENSIPYENADYYENRTDALVFRHRSYFNITYEGVEPDQKETIFISPNIEGGIPFPYSLLPNGSIPYYGLWRYRSGLLNNAANRDYVNSNVSLYPTCIENIEENPYGQFNSVNDDPFTFKIVLYYLNSPSVNVNLEIHHTAYGVTAETSTPTSTIDGLPILFDTVFLLYFPALVLTKRKFANEKR